MIDGLESGLFVPNLLVGAAFGRLVGKLMKIYTPLQASDSGTYALIGAAAVLGGMARQEHMTLSTCRLNPNASIHLRMTISLTIILLEATGDIQYGLPIMLTLLTSKWVGDAFNEGLYDLHIGLRGLHFLHWHPPAIARYLLTMDVMKTDIEVLPDVVRVRYHMPLLASKRDNH
jgi:hypothetical protein